jgi:hypothetical protein
MPVVIPFVFGAEDAVASLAVGAGRPWALLSFNIDILEIVPLPLLNVTPSVHLLEIKVLITVVTESLTKPGVGKFDQRND